MIIKGLDIIVVFAFYNQLNFNDAWKHQSDNRMKLMKKDRYVRLFLCKLGKTLAAVCFVLIGINSVQASEAVGFERLKSGNHFAIMRHAIAPGFGDPAEFELRNCATQRNISQDGIEQAKRIGDRFRENGIAEASVYTSQWCRCIDTATLLDIGVPEEFSAMNSFFAAPERKEIQDKELRDWLATADLSQPLVLVAHQVNITARVEVFPGSGEIIVVERMESGELEVADRIQAE
jgi:phosphohistidine phosphatase SixA